MRRAWSLCATLALVGRIGNVVGQTVNAVSCQSGFDWTSNSEGQSPCLVVGYLMGACGNGQFTVPPLPPNVALAYAAPNETDANPCFCSWAVYNLYQACTLCQGDTSRTVNSGPWFFHCPANDLTNNHPFPPTIQFSINTAIPYYATLNPANWTSGQFNGPQAQALAAQGKPDLTSAALSSSASSPSASPTSTHSSTPIGAIIGGVLGGILIILLVLTTIFIIYKRRHKPIPIEHMSYHDGRPSLLQAHAHSHSTSVSKSSGIYSPTVPYFPSPPPQSISPQPTLGLGLGYTSSPITPLSDSDHTTSIYAITPLVLPPSNTDLNATDRDDGPGSGSHTPSLAAATPAASTPSLISHDRKVSNGGKDAFLTAATTAYPSPGHERKYSRDKRFNPPPYAPSAGHHSSSSISVSVTSAGAGTGTAPSAWAGARSEKVPFGGVPAADTTSTNYNNNHNAMSLLSDSTGDLDATSTSGSGTGSGGAQTRSGGDGDHDGEEPLPSFQSLRLHNAHEHHEQEGHEQENGAGQATAWPNEKRARLG